MTQSVTNSEFQSQQQQTRSVPTELQTRLLNSSPTSCPRQPKVAKESPKANQLQQISFQNEEAERQDAVFKWPGTKQSSKLCQPQPQSGPKLDSLTAADRQAKKFDNGFRVCVLGGVIFGVLF